MLVGLSGKAGSGKDETGYVLEAYGFLKVSFAAKLKRVAQDVFGLSRAETSDRALKELVVSRWGLSPRRIMQEVGKKMREIHQDIWVSCLDELIAQGVSRIVVTDVRFPNEAYKIRDIGGEIWRIERPGAGSLTGSDDESETALDQWPYDVVLYNDSDLSELARKVGDIVARRGWNNGKAEAL